MYFLGRSLKTRFSALKPPLVKEKIIAIQEKTIQNHKGKRDEEFKKDKEFMSVITPTRTNLGGAKQLSKNKVIQVRTRAQ